MQTFGSRIFCLVFIFLTTFGPLHCLEKSAEISPEMFCGGCEVTVKELDSLLRRHPEKSIEKAVGKALKSVCNLDAFKKYDLDAKKVLEVCEHMKGEKDLEGALINEYGRKQDLGVKTTYLDMTQKICGEVLDICPKPSMLKLEDLKDGGITYNTDTQDFEIKYGKKVRTPKPVRHQEPMMKLQETPAPLPKPEQIQPHIHKHEEL